MPPKSTSDEVDLKVRISRSLLERVNDYRHANRLDSKKQAIVDLLEAALAQASGTVNGVTVTHSQEGT